ncbi:MAG TPA: 7-cyano-7-deazaguanine synthase QueC [Methyloceanibacter sp.]|jgi:7-cyano-7-deazaguanine synthase|nr:7-cyano-7-deazaguanine synthase QueC [Methyloceanibacter sp.]
MAAPSSSEPAGALVLFSGGQDSTICLGHALERYARVETVGFNYGQRHLVELECRTRVLAALRERFPAWGARVGADHMIDLSSFGAIGETALTSEAEIVMTESGLPSTFVPGRNLAFFVHAAALGHRRGLTVLVGGMCEADYSGYPDCRDETLRTLQEALRLATEVPFSIETPLMWLSKAQSWGLAEDLGGAAFIDLIREKTHTCYVGDHETKHDWGYGCGTCPACELRAKGYEDWRGAAAKPS